MNQSQSLLPPEVAHPYTGGYMMRDGHGYVMELCPAHPQANIWGFVQQHRLVVERHLGRFLDRKEQVHHANGDKHDNRLENLQVLTRSQHMTIHRRLYREKHFPQLSEQNVSAVLQETHNVKKAAARLGVCVQTMHNLFPKLLAPYKRRSPSNIDDPEVIAEVLRCADDPTLGYREVAKQCGLTRMTVIRICQRRGVEWTPKKKSKYRTRARLRALQNASVGQ